MEVRQCHFPVVDAVEKEPELLGGRIKDASHKSPPSWRCPPGTPTVAFVKRYRPRPDLFLVGSTNLYIMPFFGVGGEALNFTEVTSLTCPSSRSHLLILPAAHLHRLEQLTSQGYRAIAAIEPDDRAATSGAFHVVFPATEFNKM